MKFENCSNESSILLKTWTLLLSHLQILSTYTHLNMRMALVLTSMPQFLTYELGPPLHGMPQLLTPCSRSFKIAVWKKNGPYAAQLNILGHFLLTAISDFEQYGGKHSCI